MGVVDAEFVHEMKNELNVIAFKQHKISNELSSKFENGEIVDVLELLNDIKRKVEKMVEILNEAKE